MSSESINKKNTLKNSRPTIAVLVGAMTSTYQEGIMRGAAQVAAQKNYNVIGFSGGVLNSEDTRTLAREKVFELVDMDLIAGVISPFSSHMRFLDKQASQQFIEQFSGVPTINIGSYISGHTNVVTDYETGFMELFDHFYRVHGFRNLLIVRGPQHHASSEQRMNIYKKLLEKYQLPFDEDMVIYTNLNRGAAKIKMASFLDSVQKPFDAIISMNDNQALGIIDACQERGIRIPQDVALVGSMNTLQGAFATPALSSIDEPHFELGRTAAIELIAQIEGKKPAVEINIATSLVIRQSCGCQSHSYYKPYPTENNISQEASLLGKDPIFLETEHYFETTVDQYKGGIIRSEVRALLALYQQAIYEKTFDNFLIELQNQLHNALKSEDIMLWLALTAKFQLSALRYLELDTKAQPLITFIAQLISLKNEIAELAIKFQRVETDYYLNYFRATVNNLNSSFDLTTIKKHTVDILQLSEFYISLFQDINASQVTATNMIAVRKNKVIEVKNKDFIAHNLLPDGIECYQERFSLMVFPLSFRNKPIGFMTLNFSDRKGAAFENLRAIISSALKNEILVQDLKKAEERFSDIAHSTSNWLWETDVNHQFTYCSDSSSDIIGYTPARLLGKKINELNIEDGDSYIKRILSHKKLIDVECWYQHKSGNIICLLISAKPITIKGIFNGYRGIFKDITEKKVQEDKIKNLAYSDILTGLPNRTLFQDKLDETILASAKNNKKFALMFIDLDHFKDVNDTMGHAAGDLLLIKLSERLNKSIRSSDMLARLGGDEFVIILPNISSESDISHVAQHIFRNIQEPIIIYDKPIYSTLSLGISLYPTDGDDAKSLLQKGDNAMYQAKSQGRNGYVFYNKLLEQKSSLRNMQEEVLRGAIATGGFDLNYQPQVSIKTNSIIGFETLISIKNNKVGVIDADNFIALAKELSLINQIDEWLFEKVCSQYAIWKNKEAKNTQLSIKISSLQLRNNSLLDTYINILEKHQINPKDIQLAITETVLIENEQLALNVLQGFKRYGVGIALDDFGIGHSSLNCINLYPIDTIKINQKLVKSAIENPKNKAILQGIILISTNLNLHIIAKGVETATQYDFIKELGCHEMQGAYLHQPCSAAEVLSILTS